MKKMRVKKKTLKFSTILFILMLVAAITFFLLALFTPTKNSKSEPTTTTATTTTSNETSSSSETNSEQTTTETTAPETTPSANEDETTEDSKNIKQYEGTVKKTTAIPVSIVRNEVNNGRYTLSLMSDERLDATNSTCTLNMTSGQNSVKRETDVHDSSDSSGCLFQFDTSGVSSGKYSFTVVIKSGSRTGSVSGHITL